MPEFFTWYDEAAPIPPQAWGALMAPVTIQRMLRELPPEPDYIPARASRPMGMPTPVNLAILQTWGLE